MTKISKNSARIMRKRRVRAKVTGTSVRPRLAIFRSLKGIYAQVIDDSAGKTLVAARLSELPAKARKNTIAGAKEVGKLVADKCGKLKIEQIVFDRGGYQYHGKVKALAEGAREGGLKF